MPECEALARNVKKIRKEMKLSQMVFAADCGLSTATLSLIEREKTVPKLSTIQCIAAYTGREVSDLIKVEVSLPSNNCR